MNNFRIAFYMGDDVLRSVSSGDFESYVQWIKEFTKKMKDETLVDLDTHGCELTIGTRAYFPAPTLNVSKSPCKANLLPLFQAAISSGHEVTKIGEHCDTKMLEKWRSDTVYSRQVQLSENIVVRHHLIGCEPEPEDEWV